MKNRLDPRQYIPYALNTPSGNLNFVQGEDYFDAYLLEGLTGDFSITGDLSLNGQRVFTTDPTNNVGGTDVYVFGGTNNFVTGTNNGIIYASNSEISGQGNGILFGDQNQVVDASFASVLAGRNTLTSHTGAVVIGDSVLARQKNSVKVDSFNVDFSGGFFNQNNFYQASDFYIGSGASGTVSGNFSVLGTAYHTGSPLQNLQNLKDASGIFVDQIRYNSGVYITGINSLSGKLTGEYVTKGTADTIAGTKTFESNVYFVSGFNIQTVQGNLFYPSYYVSTFNTGNLGGFAPVLISKRGISLVIDSNNERNKNDKTGQFSKNAFSIYSENSIPGTGKLCFGVDASGLAWARQGLVISEQRYIPTGMRASGISGQMSWSGNFFYVCTGQDLWGRTTLAGW